ncbi:MAG: FixH family protein [Polaribacter sp.]|uniref:FixH family protein n=1 Tax=Polaribacter sp. TaxID=1920175 RepID=UPI003BB18BD4
MKFNWGTGIVVTIIAFIAFIMYFVITMSTDKKYSYDLVTEKYYQAELNYQQEINAEKNLNQLTEKVTVQKNSEGLLIKIPNKFNNEKVEGKVFLYRPSNKQLDFELPISISNTYLLVPENRLLDGRWNIKIFWKHKNTDYLFKKELIY